VVTNADIEHCTAVSGSDASRYNIGVELNAAGAEKMRVATLAQRRPADGDRCPYRWRGSSWRR